MEPNQSVTNIDPWSEGVNNGPQYTEETANAYPISPESADRLSFMAHYGLANILKKSKEDIYKDITYGGEQSTREQAAAGLNAKKGEAIANALSEIAKKRPNGLLNAEDFDYVKRAIGDLGKDTDPDTVFESAYSKEYMRALDRAGVTMGSDLSSAAMQVPAAHAKNLDLGSQLGTKTGYIDTLRARVQKMYDEQTWTGWGIDQVKMMTGVYPIAKLTGNSPNVGMGILVGENIERQAVDYFKMDTPIFKEKLTERVMKIAQDDPYAALTYLDALKGQSTKDVLLNNIFPLVDVATLPVGWAGGKAINAFHGFNTSRSGVKTMLAELNKTADHTPASIASASGNLQEAAVQKATAAVSADARGIANPTRDLVDQLPTAIITDNAEMAASPGRFGQENVNRFIERTQNMTSNLMVKLVETLRVNRLGEILSNETTVRAIMDNIKDSYTGLRNRILDITKPELESASNTWFVRMHLGDGGAVYFPSEQLAKNFARDYGLLDAKFVKAEGVNTVSPRNFTPQEIGKMAEKMKGYTKAADYVGERTEDLAGLRKYYSENLDDLRKEYYEKIRTAPNQQRTVFRSEWEAKAKGITKDIRELDEVLKTREAGKKTSGQAYWRNKDTDIPIEILHGEKPNAAPDGRMYQKVKYDGKESYVPLDEIVHPTAPEKAITQVKQQGAGWYIEKIVPLNETIPSIRNAIKQMVETPNSKAYSPRSFINDWIGRFRTPEETLSLAQRQNRQIATYATSVFREVIQDSLAEIKELKGYWPKEKWKDWQRVVEAGQDLPDEAGKKGYFFKSPHELETFYQTHIGRIPDAQEVRAYFAFKRTMEYDRMFRNLAIHRNMLRLGAEEHAFFTIADGQRVGSSKFAGVARSGMPGGEGNILIIGDKLGDETVHPLSPALHKKWEEKVASGEYKVIEVYDPERREFSSFGEKVGNTPIRYVMAKNTESKALNIDHLPRRGGGHIEYEYDHYIKQAKVRWDEVSKKHLYEGDVTLMGIPIPKIGQEVLEHLNKIREHILNKDEVAAEAYAKQHLSINWDEVRGWFKSQKNDEGVSMPPRLNEKEPLFLVSKDKNILQMDGDKLLERLGADTNNFRDATKSGSLARQFQTAFTEERDAEKLMAINVEGTKYNPIYKMHHAETVDPISTMNRALNRIVTTNFFDDYKIFSVEHWLSEAGPFLEPKKELIMHSPFWHFNNALTMFRVGADKSAVNRLKTQHMQIQQLLGVPSETDSFIEAAAQKLSDAIYEKSGKTYVLDPKRDLPFLTDPARFIRSITFHANLGLFNIPQFMVQSMNYVNMAALAPRAALSGSFAAQLHFWTRVNSHPNIIAHLDELASKFRIPGLARWRPGEFTEAMQELGRTGFGNVGREYAVLDDIMREKYITNAGKTFLDAGTIFFKGGERNARYGAWYTAFKEWRDVNPTKAITNADRADILTRADLLNMNMSRASNSTLHQGIWSIPTQFLTYQLRVAELFFGKRLGSTVQERMVNRARLVGANALMFGIPTAAGVTALPFTDSIRTYAMENGYVVGENFLKSLAMEGAPAAVGALITGNGDASKGTWFNVGDRYGTKGFETINNLMRSDKTFWDIFGGAAYSKLSSTWEATDGLRAIGMSMIRDDSKYFPPKIEDLTDVLKEAGSINSAYRLIGALNTGRLISKNEGYITDVTPANQIFSFFTGLQDQGVSDVYRLSQSMKSQQAMEKLTEKKFIQEFRRFLDNTENKNTEEAAKNFRRARSWLTISGYPEDKKQALMRMAVDKNTSLLSRIDLDFYIRKAPDDVKDVRREAMRTKLNMKSDTKPENR